MELTVENGESTEFRNVQTTQLFIYGNSLFVKTCALKAICLSGKLKDKNTTFDYSSIVNFGLCKRN